MPNPLRHFWGLWAVGTLIGTTIDVDMITLRRRGVVRILVGMMSGECFKERDEEGLFIKTDGVLRLKGYDFTFRPENVDFTPEADVVPFVRQRKGKGALMTMGWKMMALVTYQDKVLLIPWLLVWR